MKPHSLLLAPTDAFLEFIPLWRNLLHSTSCHCLFSTLVSFLFSQYASLHTFPFGHLTLFSHPRNRDQSFTPMYRTLSFRCCKLR